MKFSLRWRQAIVIALALHIVVIGIFGFLIPWIDAVDEKPPEPTVEYSSGDGSADNGDGSGDEQQEEEQQPEEEPPQQQPEPQTPVPVQENITSPVTAKDPYNAIAEKKDAGEKETKKDDGNQAGNKGEKGGKKKQGKGNPPITLKPVYPPKGIVKFKGYITVQSLIKEEGTVKKTKLMTPVRDRKNPEMDKINKLAAEYASQWLFKPATDENGNAIETYKNISIPFNQPPKLEKE